jgi:hypothetical protein
MNLNRISKGELLFDEFNSTSLNSSWLVIPNDPLRYSLVELSSYLKLFHGSTDLMVLTDEPDVSYVLDIKNNYVPQSDGIQAGIVVFKELNDNLEILEYYDVEKSSAFVYEYLRLMKNGSFYTVYARNTEASSWELVASVQFENAGKVGLIIKGPLISGAPEFEVDYVRIYKNQEVQIVNVPVGYKIEAYRENGSILGAKRVTNLYNGVSFQFDDVPPVNLTIKTYDALDNLVGSSTINVCGGDIWFYGAVLKVTVDGNDLSQDTEYVLGHFTNSEINFQVTIENTQDFTFENISLTAAQYDANIGYQFVQFLDLTDNTYKSIVNLGNILPNSVQQISAKITRSSEMIGTDVNPYKFNLKILTDSV